MAPPWYDLVRQLQGTPSAEQDLPTKRLDKHVVSGLLNEAVDVARKDSDWNSSGLPESLQRAVDLCNKQGPAVATAAALRLLDFQHIVEAKSSNSPKGSPKQGSIPSSTELHVQRADSQLGDAASRTSVPVITIKRSSETQSIPTTTTIVLQPSSVQSSLPQPAEHQGIKLHSGPSLSSRRLVHSSVGQQDSPKLHVLKSKNGRSNGSSAHSAAKSLAEMRSLQKPFDTVRVVQNGQRPKSASESHSSAQCPASPSDRAGSVHDSHGLVSERAGPPRANSPPTANSPSVSTSTAATGVDRGVDKDEASRDASAQVQQSGQCQVNPSPFEAAEAQSLRHEQHGYSRQSSSDSDKSADSAGKSKRDRDAQSAVDSASKAGSAKRQKSSTLISSGLERVVSLGTVLRCVDTRSDKEDPFDAAVGQQPATVHEVTAGASGSKLDRRASQEAGGNLKQHSAAVRASQNGNGASPAVNRAASSSPTANNEKPATVSITLSADSAQRLKAQAAESGLHQSDSGLARALGENPQIFASVVGPPISGHLSPLSFPTLPLSTPPPLVQLPMHIPPLKLDPLPEVSPSGRNLADPTRNEAQLQSAVSAELDQGSLQTTLWSGKVKHKLGSSTVELFYMTALIPKKYLEQLPPTLFVTSLATQKDVKLGRHFVMRCRLDFLSEKQLGKLQMLAQGNVVAICKLQHCTVTLVPYYDKHRALHVVGFMLSDN